MKTVKNANIVELHYEEQLPYLDMYNTVESGIKTYYNETPNSEYIEEMIEFITEFYKYTGKPYDSSIDLTNYMEVRNALMKSFEGDDSLDHVLEEFSEEYLDTELGEKYENFDEIITDGLSCELFDEVLEWADEETLIDKLMELTSFRLQRMYGNMQSEWGYSLVSNDIDSDYVEDLYSGNNWYWVEVNYNDGGYDSLGALYIRNKEDLDEVLVDHFGVYDYYLINNEIANSCMFNECKKVKEVIVKEVIVETAYVLV